MNSIKCLGLLTYTCVMPMLDLLFHSTAPKVLCMLRNQASESSTQPIRSVATVIEIVEIFEIVSLV